MLSATHPFKTRALTMNQHKYTGYCNNENKRIKLLIKHAALKQLNAASCRESSKWVSWVAYVITG